MLKRCAIPGSQSRAPIDRAIAGRVFGFYSHLSASIHTFLITTVTPRLHRIMEISGPDHLCFEDLYFVGQTALTWAPYGSTACTDSKVTSQISILFTNFTPSQSIYIFIHSSSLVHGIFYPVTVEPAHELSHELSLQPQLYQHICNELINRFSSNVHGGRPQGTHHIDKYAAIRIHCHRSGSSKAQVNISAKYLVYVSTFRVIMESLWFAK